MAARRGRLGVGVCREQLFGEPVAFGACGEKLLARVVALGDPVPQLGGETLQGLACLGGLGARFLHLFRGGGGTRLLLTPLAGKASDLGERAIALRLEQIEVAAQRAQLAGARFEIGGESRGFGPLVARLFRARRRRDLARLRHLLVQGTAHPDPGADLGDVLLETALHALSTALRRTGAPMRAWTSSSTAWMSCAPLLSESYAKIGMPSLDACANLVHCRITCLSRKSG